MSEQPFCRVCGVAHKNAPPCSEEGVHPVIRRGWDAEDRAKRDEAALVELRGGVVKEIVAALDGLPSEPTTRRGNRWLSGDYADFIEREFGEADRG